MVKIECSLVLVPPSNVSISADPADYVIEGSEQTITCKTDSYNPEASLTVRWWRNNKLATRGVSLSEIEEGLYSGKRLTGVYRFTAERRDNTALYSCSLVWNAVDIGQRRERSIVVYCKLDLFLYT